MIAEAVVGGGALAAGFTAWAVRGRSSAVFGPSVWRGNTSRRAIALTFDDGPSESTPRLLELLDRHQARATFFQCGMNAERLPEIARQVSSAGHEIGNHTHSHPRLWFRALPAVIDEVATAQKVLRKVHGVEPRYFRAPYGVRWFGLRQVQRQLGLLGVMWNVIGRDWKLDGPAIAGRVLAAAAPGAIVCLHDGRAVDRAPDIRCTIEAAARFIPELVQRGFQLQTLSEILSDDAGPNITPHPR